MFRNSVIFLFLLFFIPLKAQQKNELIPWRVNDDGYMEQPDTGLAKKLRIKSIRVINASDNSVKSYVKFRPDYKVHEMRFRSSSCYEYDDSGRIIKITEISNYFSPNVLDRDSVIALKSYQNNAVIGETYTTYRSGYSLNIQNRGINNRYYGRNYLHHIIHLYRYRHLHHRFKTNYEDSSYYKVSISGYKIDAAGNYESYKLYNISKRRDRLMASRSRNTRNSYDSYGCGTQRYISSVSRHLTKVLDFYPDGLAKTVGTRSYRTDQETSKKELEKFYPLYIYEYTFF